jgi:hypothetical protein
VLTQGETQLAPTIRLRELVHDSQRTDAQEWRIVLISQTPIAFWLHWWYNLLNSVPLLAELRRCASSLRPTKYETVGLAILAATVA